MQIVDHDRHSVRVPRRFRGPPNSGNGGVAAGLIACIGARVLGHGILGHHNPGHHNPGHHNPGHHNPGHHNAELGGVRRSQVRLHRPIPLDADLDYRTAERPEGGCSIEVVDPSAAPGTETVLSGWATNDAGSSPVDPEAVGALAAHIDLSDAERDLFNNFVEQSAASTEDFKSCFVCGPDAVGGLRLRPRPIGNGVSWLNWHPEPDWIDTGLAGQPAGANVALVPAVASLDCTSAIGLGAAGFLDDDESVLLGTYDTEIVAPLPAPDERGLRIITRPQRRDGRKIYTEIGLFSADGDPHILGLGTWIVVSADTAAGRA
jgi:hypothetical protein